MQILSNQVTVMMNSFIFLRYLCIRRRRKGRDINAKMNRCGLIPLSALNWTQFRTSITLIKVIISYHLVIRHQTDLSALMVSLWESSTWVSCTTPQLQCSKASCSTVHGPWLISWYNSFIITSLSICHQSIHVARKISYSLFLLPRLKSPLITVNISSTHVETECVLAK